MISNSLWHSYLCFSKLLLEMVDMEFRISRIKTQNKSNVVILPRKKWKRKSKYSFWLKKLLLRLRRLWERTALCSLHSSNYLAWNFPEGQKIPSS